jgi:hypothetical protein
VFNQYLLQEHLQSEAVHGFRLTSSGENPHRWMQAHIPFEQIETNTLNPRFHFLHRRPASVIRPLFPRLISPHRKEVQGD